MRQMQFVKILLKAAVMSCLCSGAILAILAFMLYQWDIGENVVHLGILLHFMYFCQYYSYGTDRYLGYLLSQFYAGSHLFFIPGI